MNDLKSHNIIVEADDMLDLAREELFRPEEDVVNYMVCKNAYKAISKYLAGFLMQKGIDIPTSLSIGDLLQRCREVGPEFKNLDLTPLSHQENPEDIWMNMDTAREFMGLAGKTRDLVIKNNGNT